MGPGQKVGEYQLISELGAGGTAVVYLARSMAKSAGKSELFVLKMLRPELELEPELVTMFLEEARLASQLRHPNVVETLEAFESGGHRFIVMEYLEGQPLNVIQNGGVRAPRLFHLRVIAEAAAGLAHAHAACDPNGRPLGIVHRDMSPHNVFVDFDGRVKILDFGIARSALRSGKTETGIVKGKFRYMAPEQFVGASVDLRADIFSLGIMIWEAITGERIWGKLSDAQIMSRLLSGAIPPLADFCDRLPRELELVCEKALAVDPAERYASCVELKEDLDRAIAVLGAPGERATLAASMETLFPGEREQRRSRIDREVAQQEARRSVAAPAPTPVETSTPPQAADTAQAAVTTISQAPPAKRRRGTAFAANLAAFAVVSAILVSVLALRGESPRTAARRPPAEPTILVASSHQASRPRASTTSPGASASASVETDRSIAQRSARPAPALAPRGPSSSATAAPPATAAPAKPSDLDRENPWK